MTDNATPLDIDNILHDFAVHIHPYAIGRGKPDDYEKYKAVAKSFLNQYCLSVIKEAMGEDELPRLPQTEEDIAWNRVNSGKILLRREALQKAKQILGGGE